MKYFLLMFGIAVVLADNSLISEFSVGYTQFITNLYKELRKVNFGNFFMCPLSAEVILALLQIGSMGNTAQQLAHALNLPNDRNKILAIFQELIPYLHGTEDYDFNTANKIYVKNGIKVKNIFKNIALRAFDTEIQNINFEKKDKAVFVINDWIEDKTFHKIKDIIVRKDLDAFTVVILINTLYFYGKWLSPFEGNTRKDHFYVNSLNRIEVDMMHTCNLFKFYENSDLNAKFLELPYEGNEITMTIVLPNDVEGLTALEDRIADVLIPPKFQYEKVNVRIPKFKVETSIQFIPFLENLGIVDAFNNAANFSYISSQQNVKISNVIQKVFIEIGEKGTTAAATSVAIGDARTGHLGKKFTADHPFIFYLKSRSIGIIFIGRYLQG